MGETWGVIHPETKFLSHCEPMKPDKLCTSKRQRWDRPRTDGPIPQGTNQKEEPDGGSQASPKVVRLKNNLLWALCPPRPPGGSVISGPQAVASPPMALGGVGLQTALALHRGRWPDDFSIFRDVPPFP